MGNAQHTPGPWTMETVRTSSGICHKVGPFPWKNGKDNHACIYVDYASEGGQLERELEANARLIAAAPDMLAALYSLLAPGNDLTTECKVAVMDAMDKALGQDRNGVPLTKAGA